MSDQPKPYMPHVAYKMDEMKSRAVLARREAAKLITQAEIWEEAASLIDSALEKERAAQGKEGGQ